MKYLVQVERIICFLGVFLDGFTSSSYRSCIADWGNMPWESRDMRQHSTCKEPLPSTLLQN